MKILLTLLLTGSFIGIAGAQTVKTNSAGDVTTCNGNVCTTVPSQTTLNAEAKAQAIVIQKQVLEEQQKALNDAALQEVIANQITNDKALSEQQAKIKDALSSLQSQTK